MRIDGNYLFLDHIGIMDSIISNLHSSYHKMILSFQVQISVDCFFIPNDCLDEVKQMLLNVSQETIPINLSKDINNDIFRLKKQEHLLVRW
jgi:hypothetical protein